MSAAAARDAFVSRRQRVVLVVRFNVSQALEWEGTGMLPSAHPVLQRIVELESAVLCQVDGLVFVSDFMRREVFARVPGATVVPNALIPNFVDRPPALDGVPPVDGDLVSIGTLEPRKNQAYQLEIVAAARARGMALRLTLIGEGPDRLRLESLARQLKVDDLVIFAGHVGNAMALMPRFRAVIHSARVENLPIALVEAMAQARPVFAAAVGGVGEIFTDGVEGRVIPLDDADAAARIVIDWWNRPGCLDAAGHAARDRFDMTFEPSAVAARLARFLHDQQPPDA